MHLAGKSMDEIAARAGVNRATVSRDLGQIEARWRDAAQGDTQHVRARLLAELNCLRRAFWDAWENSLSPRESNVVQRKEPSGEQVITNRTEHRCGNPMFLANLRWCMELTCRLWGMDKSTKPPVDLEQYDAMIAAMKACVPDAPPEEGERPCAA